MFKLYAMLCGTEKCGDKNKISYCYITFLCHLFVPSGDIKIVLVVSVCQWYLPPGHAVS